MKKMFISVIALAMGVMAMATETVYVQIKLTGESGGASNVYLTEDDAYSNAFEPGVDVEKMMSQSNSKSVLMYGFVGTTPCEDVVAANLDGLSLGFATNQVDQNYTLTFIDLDGSKTLTLYDRVLDQQTTITNNGTYNFSVDASLVGRHQINDRFFINMDASDFNISLTTNDYGWASYSNDVNLVATVPTGLKIYKGAISGDVLNLTEVNYVPANTGVIVYGAANTTYYFAAGTGTSDFSDNDLKPSSAYTVGDQNVFVLKGDALLQYVGSTALAANKAYLQLPSATPAPRRISMVINQKQGVENVVVESVKAEKFVEDGQILIRRGNEVYNLQGQMVR